MRKSLSRIPFLLLVVVLFFPSISFAFPSTVESRDKTLLWKVAGVPVASFPFSMEKKVRTVAKKLDRYYGQGFLLRELTLDRKGKNWVISIKGRPLISMDRESCSFHHSTGRLLGGRWLSNLHEGLGRLSMTPWTGRMCFHGGVTRTEGRVSWYGGSPWVGRKTASGEIYDDRQLTAAAKSLPFGTLVRVTDPCTGRNVVVRVTDRFFEPRGRLLDLSREAAEVLGIKSRGVARVTLEIIGRGKKIGGEG